MEREITIGDIIEVIARNRWALVFLFLIVFVLAFLFYMVAPRSYTAEATILPVASAGGGIADFMSKTGLGIFTGAGERANVVFVALRSRSLAEKVLNEFGDAGLIINKPNKKLGSKDMEEAVDRLRNKVLNPRVGKNGSIVIGVTLRDQSEVAGVANIYVDKLAQFLNENAISLNFVVIDEAREPLQPSSPELKVVFFISMIGYFLASLIYLTFCFKFYK